MAELVDAADSKSASERSAGSIPARGTISKHDNCPSENDEETTRETGSSPGDC